MSSPRSTEPVHAGHILRYRRVSDPQDPAYDGFVRTYQHAFADHPYYELTPPDAIQHIWHQHLPHLILLAECVTCNNVVVGFSCAHSLNADVHPDIRAFLQQFDGTPDALPFDCRQAIYMSEVAVLGRARQMGIGTALIQLRRRWAAMNGIPYYIMRTAEHGSNSAGLYLKDPVNATRASFIQNVAGVEGEIASASTRRMWLYGNTAHNDPVPDHVEW